LQGLLLRAVLWLVLRMFASRKDAKTIFITQGPCSKLCALASLREIVLDPFAPWCLGVSIFVGRGK